jgi:uncharacterized protein
MKWAWRILRVLVLSYLGVCLVLWLLENKLLFRPLKAQDDWQPAPTGEILDVELKSADGTRIHAWWLPCPGADQAMIYCHGNAGNLSHRGRSIVKVSQILKAHVLIFDYPGYGKSEGTPSEKGCYQAADAAHAYLTDTQKIDPGKIIYYGGSLGGGVAVELASRKPPRALMLVKTFTSAPDAGAELFPWLPVRWLMSNRFDNLTKIKSIHVPVFIAHGTADKLIAFKHGQRLFEAANEPKQFFTIEGADHNDPLPAEVFTAFWNFLQQNPV